MTYKQTIPFPELPPRIVDNKIRFAWCTDVHIGDNTTDPQFTALQDAVTYVNTWKPQAFVLTGDIGDNTTFSINNAFSQIRACQVKVIAAIGNHDEEEVSGGLGNPNTEDIATVTAFNQDAPFYYSTHLTSGDGSWTVLCLVLDCNFYKDDPLNVRDVANHADGDRIGHSSVQPAGGTYRQFTQAQLDWVESTLQADNSEAVLVFVHYPPVIVSCVDYVDLVDILQADGRHIVGYCGHSHGNADIRTQLSSDGLYTFNLYKCPAMKESYSWTEVELSFDGSAIVHERLEIMNYNSPLGWVINLPFMVSV